MVIEKELFVDSGSMCFCNIKDLEKYGAETFGDGLLIPLEKGKYEIDIHLPDTWNDEINLKKTVEVEDKAEFYLGDPCYCFSGDSWDTFLSATNYGTTSEYTEILTGGDGDFEVKVTVNKIGD
jgi:hypothetical protein